MNLFIFDATDHANNAKLHPNKLICKMQLESCQILASALHPFATILKLNGTPYKITHSNHPCTKWAGSTQANFVWVCNYALSLAGEYEKRYGKPSSYRPAIQSALAQSKLIPSGPLTPFAIAINDFYLQCMLQDGTITEQEYAEHSKTAPGPIAQKLYRAYLVLAKAHYADWPNQLVPSFWPRQEANGRLFCKLKRYANSDLVPFDSSTIGQNAKELEFSAILAASKKASSKLSKRKLLEAFANGLDCYALIDGQTRNEAPSIDTIASYSSIDALREAIKGWLNNRKVPTAKTLAKWAEGNNLSERVLEHIVYWAEH